MNPFLLRTREMLRDWRSFRESLSSKPEAVQLQEVARYWAQAPLFKQAYSPIEPANWTSPWEMIGANRWCRKSTAIGMEFTLRLAGWDPSRMVLKLLVDYDLNDTFFVLEIDGSTWLNHEYRRVIPVGGNYEELCAFVFDGSNYVEIAVAHDLAA